MNKKIVIGCIGIVFMLVAITMVSAVNSNNGEITESPLFRYRTNIATKNKYFNLKETLKSRFILNTIVRIPKFKISNEEITTEYIYAKGGATILGVSCTNPYSCYVPACWTKSSSTCKSGCTLLDTCDIFSCRICR